MKHTSMLDLIILHKGEGGKKKKVYSGITSPGMGLGILVVPSSRVRKIPRCGCSFFVLCSFIANKHTVCYCFPTRTSELRKYSFFFSFCSSKMKYRSVSYISLLQFGKHFRSIFKVWKCFFAKFGNSSCIRLFPVFKPLFLFLFFLFY